MCGTKSSSSLSLGRRPMYPNPMSFLIYHFRFTLYRGVKTKSWEKIGAHFESPTAMRRSLAYRLREVGVSESAARELARQPTPVPEDPDRAFDAPESD